MPSNSDQDYLAQNHPAESKSALDKANLNLLRVYAYYRFFLAGLLMSMFVFGFADDILGKSQPDFFYFTIAAYTAINFLTLVLIGPVRYVPGTPQIVFILLTDIAAITLLMESSGGIQSGLGFLLLISVAAGSLFVSGQLALLLAATSSVFVILSSMAGLLGERTESSTVFQAGLLGGLLFITALFFHLLTRRLRRAQLEALQKTRSAAQLQQLNEHIVRRMRTGIIVVNAEGIIQLINDAAVQLLGGQPVEGALAAGRNIREVSALFQQFERWENAPWLRTQPFKERNSTCEVQANFTPLEQGEEEQVLIFLEDTRALSQHAQQIKQASLSRMTGSIAHEIRNPLGAISHASQLLQEDPNLGQQARIIQIIKKQSDRVNHLIENVMQLSRQQTPELQKLDLNNWLKSFVEEYNESRKSQPTIEIADTEIANTSPCQVLFDRSHLSQVLTNLLDNALRYSKQESGEEWACLRPSLDEASGHPFLDVLDRGPGISEEDRSHLFEPFFTTSHEGTGLGLYLSQELCELNFSTLSYLGNSRQESFFRIGFAHPDRLLPGQKS